jgi:hypothetical protein
MPWISINPDSEPKTSVEAAAYIIGIKPEEITSTQMATAYNLLNPTNSEEETASSTGWTKKTFDSLFDEVDEEEESQS